MKKISMFYRMIIAAFMLAGSFSYSGVVWGGETADGFVEVPWGAGRSQVALTMKEKGFTLVTNKVKDLYDADIYRGSFAGHPADLYFHYNGRDSLDSGWAFLLSFQGQGLDVAMSGYYNIMPLLRAKYGAFDKELTGEQFRLCNWNTVPTKKGVNPGVVEIKMQGGRIPDFSGRNNNLHGVWVQYRYRSMKDI